MSEGNLKPASGWKKARSPQSALKSPVSFEESDDDLPTTRKNRLDPLTEHLGCAGYYYKMRWQWLFFEHGGLKHPLEVDRFYHVKLLAIDFGKVNDEILNVKKLAFKKNGIKYINLKSPLDFASLEAK
jgi:hypothetical protein